MLRRLIDVIDKRYDTVQRGLLTALNGLYPIATEAETVSDPRADSLDNILHTLAIVTSKARGLQEDVIEILYVQLVQSQSAKNAYDQGWRDRLVDLLARATPEQVAVLEEIARSGE